ncbi:MAG: site-specific DNA-methyltransferase [Bacteroidales bacterium]|nr:site-specific DNA-methyltransferase [Bacteroidales bacterium]
MSKEICHPHSRNKLQRLKMQMPMKLYETLCTQLKKENNFVSDNGELKKWVVADKARNYDAGLLALLLENEDLKNIFFKDINGTLVFLLEQFLLFIEQKNYLNDSYTSYRNKIGLAIGGKFLNQRNEVELVWPYKDCILEGGQTKEDQKRPEIFFNQTLAQDEITQLLDPKVLTNAKRYGTDGAHIVSAFTRDAELNRKRGLPENTITDNLIIKGNNLLALHSLKKEFAGKVKLIYIDPPYNTGNDSFGYNDSFNHSTWLTFMKNRLEVARTLLKDDGAIFVQIDHHELAYIMVLLDEIYGIHNKVQVIAVKTASVSGFKAVNPGPIDVTEYILFYTKDKTKFNFRKNYVPMGYNKNYNKYLEKHNSENPDKWEFIPIKDKLLMSLGKTEKELKVQFGLVYNVAIDSMIAQYAYENADKIISVRDLHKPTDKIKELQRLSKINRDKIYTYEKVDGGKTYIINGGAIAFYSSKLQIIDGEKCVTELLSDFWNHVSWAGIAGEGQITFKNAKKPEKLIKQIFEIASSDSDIVLDFFGGSGTTAAVAHKMNRQYISCEQIDSQMDLITNRLQNVINGDQSGISKSVSWNPQNPSLEDSANGRYERNNFIYLELKKYNQAFIEKIEEADSSEKLLEIWELMKEKSFLNYNVDIKTQEANIEEFKQLELEQQKQVLCELLDKNQLYVNVSDMNDGRFATTEEEKNVTQAFYSNL